MTPEIPGGRETTTVTLLFTDLVGSTDLLERLGDDGAERLRRAHFRLLRETLSRQGGREVKNLGDGLMVAFPSAVQAVGCAIDIQRAVERHNQVEEGRLAVRIGLHVGDAFRDDDDYFGTAVVIAKRLCDMATGGQIIASELVHALVGSRGGHHFVGLGALDLKGLSSSVRAVEVAWRPQTEAALPSALRFHDASFVGREAEIAALERAWDLACSGERSVVFVSGEPGIGKTTLAGRLAARAQAQGAAVLFGRCDEESLGPYQPFVEALNEFVAAEAPETLRKIVGDHGPILTRLVTRLPYVLTDVAVGPAGESESERYRLFEAVASLIASATLVKPMVLVLDDLQWADPSTLLLLRYLARRSEPARLLIIATYRDTDLGRGHPLSEMLGDFRRVGLSTRLTLRGLTAADVAASLASEEHGTPTSGERRMGVLLEEETQGNPLFIGEIMRHLSEMGSPSQLDAGAVGRAMSDLALTDGVKEVIARRLVRLSEEANQLLRIAAILGRHFSFSVLEAVSDVAIEPLLDALDEAINARLVVEVSDDGQYRFSHALVKDVLYEETHSARRRRLHRRAGEAIETVFRHAIDDHLAELVHHFVNAGTADSAVKAVTYASRAGAQATMVFAFEEAIRLYQTALGLIDLAGHGDDVRTDLLLALGEAQWRSGAGPAGRASCAAAAQLARDSKDSERLARAALGCAGVGVRIWWVEVAVIDAPLLRMLEEALEQLGPHDSLLRCRITACLAKELYFKPGTEARRESLSASALEMTRRIGDQATLSEVLAHRNHAVYGPDTLAQNLNVAGEIIELGVRLGDRETLLHGRAHRAQALFLLGDVAAAYREVDLAEELGDELRQPNHRTLLLIARSLQAQLEGRFDDAEQLALEMFHTGQQAEDPNMVMFFGAMVFSIRREQGRLAEIAPALPGFVRHYPDLIVWRAGLASTLSDLGLIKEAVAEFESLAVHDFVDLPRDFAWFTSIALLAEVAASAGDDVRARMLYELLLPYRAVNIILAGPFGILGPAEGFLGLLAGTARRWQEATTHFEAALESSRRMGTPCITARLQVKYGRMRSARSGPGDRDAAIELAKSGLATARAFNMAGVAAEAALLLGSLSDGAIDVDPRLVPRSRLVTTRDQARAALSLRGRSALDRLTREVTPQRIRDRFSSGVSQRALFAAVARSFQPSLAFGFQGDICFHLVDDGTRTTWTIEVTGRRATARRGSTANPALTVTIGVADFVHLVGGVLHPITALVQKRARLEGDISLAARLVEMFGAPLPFDLPVPPSDLSSDSELGQYAEIVPLKSFRRSS